MCYFKCKWIKDLQISYTHIGADDKIDVWKLFRYKNIITHIRSSLSLLRLPYLPYPYVSTPMCNKTLLVYLSHTNIATQTHVKMMIEEQCPAGHSSWSPFPPSAVFAASQRHELCQPLTKAQTPQTGFICWLSSGVNPLAQVQLKVWKKGLINSLFL